MSVIILFAVLWVISPLALIPVVVVLAAKNSELNAKLKRLSGQTQPTQVQQRPVMPQPTVAQPQPAVVQPQPAAVQPQPTAVQPQPTVAQQRPAAVPPQMRPVANQKTGAVTSSTGLKPVHLLFGIGTLLVVVAGLIFATTTWRLIPSTGKLLILSAVILLFFACSFILEKWMHLKQTSVTFYMLGSFFSSLVVIAVGYFSWFGSSFSLFGEGRFLLCFISLILLGILLLLGHFFYKMRVFLILSSLFLSASLVFLCRHVTPDAGKMLCIMGIYLLGFTCLMFLEKWKKSFGITVIILDVAYIVLTIILLSISETSVFICLALCLSHAAILMLAFIYKQAWINWILPLYSMLSVFSVSGLCSSKWESLYVSEGAIYQMVFTIACLICFLIYTLIRFRKKAVFRTIVSDWIFTFAILIQSFYACVSMQMQNEVVGEADVLACIIQWVLAAVTAAVILLLSLRDENKWFRQSLLASMSVMGMSALYALVFKLLIWQSDEWKMILPMLFLAVLYLIGIVARSYIKKIFTDTVFAGRLLRIWQHISLTFAAFTCLITEQRTLWMSFCLLAVILLLQGIYYKRQHNFYGIFSALLFPFVSMLGLKEAAVAFTGDEAAALICTADIKIAVCLLLILSSSFLYSGFVDRKKLIKGDKNTFTGLHIDWNYVTLSLMILILTVQTIDGSSRGLSAAQMWFLLLFYVCYTASRCARMVQPYVYSAACVCGCFAWMTQQMIPLPEICGNECRALILLGCGFVLYRFVWKEKPKAGAWIGYALLAVFLLEQAKGVHAYAGEPGVYKLTVFLIVVCVLLVFAFRKAKLRYMLLTGGTLMAAAYLTLDSIMSEEHAAFFTDSIQPAITCAGIFTLLNVLLMAGMCILLPVLMYREKESCVVCVPVIIYYYILASVIDYLQLEETSANLLWLMMFLLMVMLGRRLHEKTVEIHESVEGDCGASKHLMIDWMGISGIISPIIQLFSKAEGWRFCGLMLLAVYVLCFHDRISQKLNRWLASIAACFITIAWWTQPFLNIPTLLKTEWKIAGLIGFLSVITFAVWKEYKAVCSWVLFGGSVCCVLWQSLDTIRFQKLTDTLILAVAVLLILLYAFIKKSGRWFLLSSMTLVILVIYLSRDFWKSIAWWIYLLAAGILLIVFAATNEYRKKQDKKEPTKQLFHEWEW